MDKSKDLRNGLRYAFRIAVGITMLVLLLACGAGATKLIRNDVIGGDCTSFGTWNAATKICTMTADLTEEIQIESNGITLDGNGHTIMSYTNNGINLSSRTGVTIKNITLSMNTYPYEGPYNGIYLDSSSNNTLIGNNVSSSIKGISLFLSSNNTLIGNTASGNFHGIYLDSSSNNTLIGNNASSNNGHQQGWLGGIILASSTNNTLIDNNANGNWRFGIGLFASNNNTLIGNNANNNHGQECGCNHNVGPGIGITLTSSNNNKLISNNANGNYVEIFGMGWMGQGDGIDIFLEDSNNNIIYNNILKNYDFSYFSSNINTCNITKQSGTNIIGGPFLGGNFWKGFSETCSDVNNDGICDEPYVLDINNIDYLPLTFIPPTISFINPTPANGATLNQNYALLNASVSDSSIAFIDWNHSLVSWWRFNNESGENPLLFRDSSSFENHGTCSGVNCPSFTPGKFRNALGFDGINDYVDAGSGENLDITDAITIEAWINPEIAQEICWDGVSGNNGVMSKVSAPADSVNWSWQLRYGAPDGGCYLGYQFNGDPEGSRWVTVKQNLITGQWYHIVGTFNGTDINSYLNGNLKDTNKITAIKGYRNKLLIGTEGWGHYFKGKIDEVRIHRRALSPEEIKASYDVGIYRLYRNFTDLAIGSYNYQAYAQNLAGAVDQTEKRTLILIAAADTTPSQVTGLINDTPTFTTVNLSWSPTANASHYRIYRNFSLRTTTQNTYWNETGLEPDTLYQYQVRANDSYNNWGENSSILSVRTAFPIAPPPGPAASSINISINNGSVYSNSTSVILTLSATGANQMSFKNESYNWTSWITFNASKSWRLSNGDGLKTVYFKTWNGTNESTPVNDSIILDTNPPSVNITSPVNDSFVNVLNVSFTGNATDSSGMTKACIGQTFGSGGSSSMGCGGLSNIMTSIAFSHSLTLQEGKNTITINYYDVAGNAGSAMVNVTLDRIKPDVTDLSLSTSTPGINQRVNITVHVKDTNINTSGISVLVTSPGGFTNTIPMNGSIGGKYYGNFTNTSEYGRYNVTVMAGDLAGNINNTETTWFVTTMPPYANNSVNTTANNVTEINALEKANTTLELFTSNDTKSGAITITLSSALPPEINQTFSLTALGKYIMIDASKDLKNNLTSGWIIIKLYYTGSELNGLDETSLRFSWYNETSGSWENLESGSPAWVHAAGVATADINGFAGYVWANISHLSRFGIVGSSPAVSQPVTSNSGGGGGGGGGGGPSGEDFANILVKEKYDLHIYKDIVTSYKFTNINNPISSINIVGNVNAGEIGTAVEVLRNTSSLVKTPAPGNVYKNVNVWVGTSGFGSPKNIKEAVITFRITNSWISGNNIDSSGIKMVRWDGSIWDQLETSEKKDDGTFTYYEAKTNAFSSFAITQLREAVSNTLPQGTAQSGIPANVTGTASTEGKSEGAQPVNFFIIIVVLAVIGTVVAVYLKKRGIF